MLAAFIAATSGCSPHVDIQVISYPWAQQRPAKPPQRCLPHIFGQHDTRPSHCEPIGDVFIGDNGLTLDCDADRMFGELRKQTCAFGADAAQIVYAPNPSTQRGYNCHELRAVFLRCQDTTAKRP